MTIISKPQAIEARSFEIIDSEAPGHGFSEREWQVVRRMIHTSADFDYMTTVRFQNQPIQKGIEAIRSGADIITDTTMAAAGIRKRDIEKYGGQIICRIADPEVRREAEKSGKTRAVVAVEKSVDMMKGGIYVVGNAPTALIRLSELITENRIEPALVVGLPVGFVNIEESKSFIIKTGWPAITNTGRKGGSNVAAAVINALIIMANSDLF